MHDGVVGIDVGIECVVSHGMEVQCLGCGVCDKLGDRGCRKPCNFLCEIGLGCVPLYVSVGPSGGL